MATLYVQEQGTRIQKRGHQVLVVRGGETIQEIPLGTLDQMVVMGRGVQVSTALLVELLRRGVPVILTNQRGSWHYATLTSGPSRFGALRTQQMALVQDPVRALELARQIVRAKLTNQLALLQGTGWASAAAAVPQIDTARQRLSQATTLDMLRGYEGSAAAAYFGAWQRVFASDWSFAGRAFYPPPDPLNALLSFGYTLLLHDMLTAVQITGLDPYLGTFHALEPGRPSLALDLMEEFRPLVVDRLVLALIHERVITRERFEHPAWRQQAVYLDQEGRRTMIARYEQVLQQRVPLATGEQTTLRRVLLLQAQAVARVFRGEQTQYTGFTPV